MANEWAETPEDILWRRSKLGLHLEETGKAALAEYERALFPRSTAEATEAPRDFEICFGADTPRSLLGLFASDEQAAAS